MTVLTLMACLHGRERHREFEDGAAALIGTGRDVATMRFDDGSADRKTYAHSVRLAGYEGLKQMRRDLRADTGAGIRHREERGPTAPRHCDREVAVVCGFHRLDSVPD